LSRLRAFLFVVAAALFLGTIAELLAAKHWQEPMQFVPFAFCGFGLMALAAAWRNPSRRTLQGVRALMTIIALGSLLGVYEHVEGNLEFARELRPDASGWSLWREALTGRDPLLAAGVFAVGAALAIAATSVPVVRTEAPSQNIEEKSDAGEQVRATHLRLNPTQQRR
jgi:hypothetical protein